MKLAIGSDHAGFKLKEKLLPWLRRPQAGRNVLYDAGTQSDESCDYPDFAIKVAKAVARKKASKGILICGTGIGMAIAANKVHGIRAAVAWNPEVAALAAEHNGANVLCLAARFTTFKNAQKIVKAFLTTPFGGGRHARRIGLISQIDRCV